MNKKLKKKTVQIDAIEIDRPDNLMKCDWITTTTTQTKMK